LTEIIIDKRYCGPPNSGNGGYVCGRLAQHIPGGAEVTLRAPPPLDKPLDAAATEAKSAVCGYRLAPWAQGMYALVGRMQALANTVFRSGWRRARAR